jgi:hypothetical protein
MEPDGDGVTASPATNRFERPRERSDRRRVSLREADDETVKKEVDRP